MKEILTILIAISGIQNVGNGKEWSQMILFGGEAKSEYFTGKVLPGGVDTQHGNDTISYLSARYFLEGVDFKGDSCKIFIENNGCSKEQYTKPKIMTNSKALNFLNDADLKGKLDMSDGKLTIRIYAEE